MKNMLSSDKVAMVAVEPYVQIIPAGYYTDEKGVIKLRAVAVVIPDPLKADDSGIYLANWPGDFIAKIQEQKWTIPITVCIAQKQSDDKKKPHPEPENASLTIKLDATAKLLKNTVNKKGFIEESKSFWIDSLGPGDPKLNEVHWKNLVNLISKSLSGKRTSPGNSIQQEDPYHNTPETESFGNKGQIKSLISPNKPNQIEAVLPIRYTSAAVALEMRRVEELCDSLKKKSNEICDPKLEAEYERFRKLKDLFLDSKASKELKQWVGSFVVTNSEGLSCDKLSEILPTDNENERYGKGINSQDANLASQQKDSASFSQQVLKKLKDFFFDSNENKESCDKLSEILPTDNENEQYEKEIKTQEAKLACELKERKKNDYTQLYLDTKELRRDSASLFQQALKRRVQDDCDCPDLSLAWKDGLSDLRHKNSRNDAFSEALKTHLYATWPQHEDENNITVFEESDGDLECASRNFFILQSTPTLARFVLLNIDLEFKVNEIKEKLKQLPNSEWNISKDEKPAALLFLSSDWSNKNRAIPWVLAKLRFKEDWKPNHFLPASDEELRIFSEKNLLAENVSQFDGHVVMSAGIKSEENDLCVTRFDATSLDVRMALELEGQRTLIRQENVRADIRDNRDKTESGDSSDEKSRSNWSDHLAHGATFDTAGIVVLDRFAHQEVVKKLAGREATCEDGCSVRTATDGSSYVVLDADDISVGFRLDLGVATEENGTVWKTLANRKIQYGTGKLHKDIEKYLEILIDKEGYTKRLALDRAILGKQNRLLPHVTPSPMKSENSNHVEVVVDEEVARTTGEPMGLSNSLIDGEVFDSLPLGRKISLPIVGDQNENDLALRLRFGNPVRLNLVRVYSGGVAAEPGLIKEADAILKCKVAFPPADRADALPYFRFLRQHRIASPIVSLGEYEALQIWEGGAAAAPVMLVRSFVGENNPEFKNIRDKLKEPETTARFVFPPAVSFDKAILHGVFDNDNEPKPSGALRQVKFIEGGALPSVKTSYISGFDRAHFMKGRYIEDENKPENQNADSNVRRGDSVIVIDEEIPPCPPFIPLHPCHFNPLPGTDYFPDPAAEIIAIGIRQMDDPRYLPLKNNIPLAYEYVFRKGRVGREDEGYRDNLNYYPNLRDLKLVLDNSKCRDKNSDILHASDLIEYKKEYNKCQQTEEVCKHIQSDEWVFENNEWKKRKILGHELTLKLRQGESFEVDMWCVPSINQLAKEFALVQALAVYVCKEHESGRFCSSQAALKGLASIIKDSEPKLAEEAEILACNITEMLTKEIKETRGFFATGSYITPPPDVIKCIAKCLHNIMLRRPLTEFSSISTIRAIHAVERPMEEPVLCASLNGVELSSRMKTAALPPNGVFEQDCLRISRPSDDIFVRVHASTDENGNPSATIAMDLFSKTVKEGDEISKGSTNVVLKGDLEIDLDTTSGFELSVRTVQPGSSVFDDEKRGRSLAGRRSGKWPERKKVEDGEIKINEKKTAEEIFGFSLKQIGTVSHSTSDVTLISVHDLPRDGERLKNASKGSKPGYTKFSIDRFFLRDSDSTEGWRTINRHVFPDGKARLLEVTPKAISRTLEYMKTVRHYKDSTFYLPEEVPGEFTTTSGTTRQVILPATIRPAKPKAQAPYPGFRQQRESGDAGKNYMIKLTRTTVVRISLGREWFSSGMFEQLGIVVWPPELGENKYIENDFAPITGNGKQLLDVRDFIDEDLGAGGQFITRLGADPIRLSSNEFEEKPDGNEWIRPGVLLPKKAFRDLNRKDDDRKKARFVGNLLMPFGKEDDPDQPEIKQSETINVGIVHYEPLFDPENETWYVDVELDPQALSEPFVRFGLVRYQPCTRSDLHLSRPVVQWAQIMPQRDVYAKIGDGKIQIEVEGPASMGAKPLGCDNKTYYGNGKKFAHPRMHFHSFVEVSDSEGKKILLREIDHMNSVSDSGKEPESTFDDGRAIWKHELLLPKDFKPGIGNKKYKLFIEEIDWRRPAEYPREPISLEDLLEKNDLFVPSGPRFSVCLEITKLFEKLSENAKN